MEMLVHNARYNKDFFYNSAFAAVRADNKVITWGSGATGGDSSSVSSIINGTLDADAISVSASVSAEVIWPWWRSNLKWSGFF